ncbi:TPA: hypothetical protein DEO28_01030 [Candidatus Dependentiae bacterium]|nr:MAG: hypothetical protein UR14_C0003G0058 [candidate division TM6 bacterium GW2011_GWE2_31_21]KKP53778.1 MAG: hypothetical protein UR43_C0003G0099 [candidate division TM6 bacterium GW2011_GWF2_33_332]HBS48468.1 hypothetical protein [Candidatus Dependentiae bacterium]HBZ73083.1 hypothetical protein [Candidatus Dependentiae bacterium]
MKIKILFLAAALALVSPTMYAGGAEPESQSKIDKKAQKKAEEAARKAEKELKKSKHEQEHAAKKAEEARKEQLKKAEEHAKKEAEKAKHEAEKAKKAEEKALKDQEHKIKEQKEKEKREAKKAQQKLDKDARRAEVKAAQKAEDQRAKDKREKDKLPGKYSFLYKQPSWNFEAMPFKKSDFVAFDGKFQYATKAYSSSDHSQDISKLAFGQAPIRVQDILLVSKLVYNEEALPISGVATDSYLHYLANQEITFKGEMSEWRGSLDIARHLTKEISIGFQIPFVSRHQKAELQYSMDTATKTKLDSTAATNDFPAEYNHNFQAFLDDIFAEKEIYYNKRNSVNGIGDISIFFNYDIKSKHLEYFKTGIKLLFPTARDRDIHKLWDAELGNGGFTELSPYIAMLYANCTYFNPHVFAQATYGMTAKVDRRVAKVRSFDGSEAPNTTLSTIDQSDMNMLVMADRAKTKDDGTGATSITFDSPDSATRRFSDQTLRIKLQPGAALNFRIGNVFERFCCKKGFLDIFYDLYLRGKDHVGSGLDTNSWNASNLIENTYQVSHKICLNFQHQFDKHNRLEIGGKYTFAGRNIARIYELDAAFRVDF